MNESNDGMYLLNKKLFKVTLIVPDGKRTGTYEVFNVSASNENLAKDLIVQRYEETTGKSKDGIKVFAEEGEEILIAVMKKESEIIRGGIGATNTISWCSDGSGSGYVHTSGSNPFDL